MNDLAPTRALALYNWTEEFSFSDHRDVLTELVEDSWIIPTKLEFEIGKDKRKRATVTKNHGFRERLEQAPPFNGFDFCRPIGGNYLNTKSEITCSIATYRKRYTLSIFAERLPVSDLLRHVALFVPAHDAEIWPVHGDDAIFYCDFLPWWHRRDRHIATTEPLRLCARQYNENL